MIVKAPEERFPAAPEGTFSAVCVDEIDLGRVKTTYAGEERERNMVRLVWQLDEDEKDDKGKRYLVKQDYTASLDEKAKLRKHLQSWRGRAFLPTELVGFDLETVVGHGCLVSIVHAQGRKGGTFANVEGIMKLPKGVAVPRITDYVRVKDRVTAAPALVSQPKSRAPEMQPPDVVQEFGDDYQGVDNDVPF